MSQNIRFLLNTEKNRVVVQSCEPIDRDNFVVPDFNSVCQFEISSINFLNVVYRMAKWDSEKTYRVEGKHYKANHLVEFDLRCSVQISDDEFVDEDAIILDSIKQKWEKYDLLIVILDVIWLSIMLYLSHASGEHTYRHSRELHRITRINEHSLRVMAHLFCYAVLGLL